MSSPRIITVANIVDSITIQDLLDTMRIHEDNPENLSQPKIVRATGKQELTSNLLVGITLTLLNAKLKFDDNLSPPTQRRDVIGGNLLAVDDMDDAIDPIEVSDFTQVVYNISPSPTLVVGSGTRVSGILQG